MQPKTIESVDLVHSNGTRATILTYGAALQDLQVPAPEGRRRVVLGFADPALYPEHSPHFGAIPGRYANRIGRGRFTLDGISYQLDLNQHGKHHLHGGSRGFGKSIWQVRGLSETHVTLGFDSPDGDMGYPGRAQVSVTYRLTEMAGLAVEIEAEVDKPCPINLCNHAYFNLADAGRGSIRDHLLEIDADAYTEIDADLIPTGRNLPVDGTPWDFRKQRPIRAFDRENGVHHYDHNFVLRGADGSFRRVARLSAPDGDLAMEVWTTQPGVQFYDGMKVAPEPEGLDGVRYGAFSGLCLETQHFPDSPNHPAFPSTILRPGEHYSQRTEFRFASA